MTQEHAVAAALAQTKYLAAREQNPCSSQLPPIPTKQAAMRELTRGRIVRQHRGAGELPVTGADLLLANDKLAELLIDVTANVHEGYAARDLNRADIRARVITASEFVNHSSNQHGHALTLPAINLPDAKPRGILTIAQARMGRRVIVDAIQGYLGREARSVTVQVGPGQVVAYWMVPTLRVQWPAGGSLRKFVRTLLRSFDAVTGTRLSEQRRGSFHRDEPDVQAALCALGVAANLGLLIVERINTRDATGSSASTLWDTLGQFTRTTGIPILCMATPGAATALAEYSSAAGELAVHGPHVLTPPERDSRSWRAASTAIFDAYLRTEDFPLPPEWLLSALWDVSLGIYGLATKVCRHVDMRLSGKPRKCRGISALYRVGVSAERKARSGARS